MEALLERDRELATMRDAFSAVSGGAHRLVLLEGPAGIGKTALLSLTCLMAHDRGLRVLAARSSEVESRYPFGVVRQLFEPPLSDAEDEERSALLAAGAAGAARVLAPEAQGDLAAQSRAETPYAALHALHVLLTNLCARGPLLLAIDEAHWSDAPSLRFLVYLARRLEQLPVMLLLAARSEETGSDSRLFAELLNDPAMHLVHPRPLSPDAVALLVERELAAAPEPGFVTACHAATAGNPFLTRQLVADLSTEGIAPVAAAADRISVLAPQSVTRWVLLRLSRLPAGATALGEALALLGGEADLGLTARLAQLDEEAATEAADALARARLISAGRPLRFIHPLVRAALYSNFPPGSRAQGHARAARLLADAGAAAEAVAAHLLETEGRGDTEVVRTLRRAARQAFEHGALEAAGRYLSRAITEPPRPRERVAVLRELGEAELWSGHPAAGAEHLAAALAATRKPAERVDVAVLLRQCFVRTERIPDALAMLDKVREGLPPEEAQLRDLLDAAAVGAALLDTRLAPQLGDRVRGLIERAEDPSCREPLTLEVAAAATAWAALAVERATELAVRGARLRSAVRPAARMPFEGFLLASLLAAEQLELGLRVSDAFRAEVRRQGALPEVMWGVAAYASLIALRAGRLGRAETEAREAIETARLYGHEAYLTLAYASVTDCLVERGRLADADDVLLEGGLASGHRPTWYSSVATLSRARLRAAQGRREDALEELHTLAELHLSDVLKAPTIWPWRSQAALLWVAQGDRVTARRLAAEEVELAQRMGARGATGTALRAVALATEGTEAVGLLEKSVDMLRSSEARLELARALADLGAALRRTGRRSDSRPLLREAEAMAAECGSTRLAQFARDELAASGARRLAADRHRSVLTASERRVAALAAEGLSNPEIAARLFLARRTVETHLTSTYGKLGIRSRSELPAALADAGSDGR